MARIPWLRKGPSDAELVSRALAGHQLEAELLVDRYGKKVRRAVNQIFPPGEDAKEVYQEAWLRIFKGLSTYDHDQPLGGWIYIVALNTAKTIYGRRRIRAKHRDEYVRMTSVREAHRRDSDEARMAGLEWAISMLSERDQTIIALRIHQDYSFREIGEVLGITENAARQAYDRCKKRLRSSLK